MTDTHTHLYMDSYAGEQSLAVERAIEAGVGRMVFPGVSPESNDALIALHRLFPENTRIGLGLHPTELGENWQETLNALEPLLESGEFSAIGETGIDLHWDASNIEAQMQAFDCQLEWAQRKNLPVIIHCRNGLHQTLEVIKGRQESLPDLIFHSFTSGREDVEEIRKVCNPWFGINGVVTFKNASNLREALPGIGIDRILLETDSPYLAPTPYRGKRNESAYIPLIRDKVAECLNMSREEVERVSDSSAADIFRF